MPSQYRYLNHLNKHHHEDPFRLSPRDLVPIQPPFSQTITTTITTTVYRNANARSASVQTLSHETNYPLRESRIGRLTRLTVTFNLEIIQSQSRPDSQTRFAETDSSLYGLIAACLLPSPDSMFDHLLKTERTPHPLQGKAIRLWKSKDY